MGEHTTHLFEQIEVGKQVYDRNGEEIGKVKYVQFPSATPNLDDFPYGLRVGNAYALMAHRLLESGFVSIDSVTFGKDRLVVPDQIAFVHEGKVQLRVKKDDLARI